MADLEGNHGGEDEATVAAVRFLAQICRDIESEICKVELAVALERRGVDYKIGIAALLAEELIDEYWCNSTGQGPSIVFHIVPRRQIEAWMRKNDVQLSHPTESDHPTEAGEVDPLVLELKSRLEFDSRECRVRLDQTWYEVTDSAFRLLEALWNAYPQAVPASSVDPTFRPDRIKKGLPARLKPILRSDKGVGCRLDLNGD